VQNCDAGPLVREPTLTDGTVRLRRWTMADLLPRPQEGVTEIGHWPVPGARGRGLAEP
jgi:hypothetical protein